MKPGIELSPIILIDLNRIWEKVADLGMPVSFTPKTVISPGMSQGIFVSPGMASGMYYIKRGRIKLSYIAANGHEQVMLYMGRGTLFSEIPMLNVGSDYLFTSMEQMESIFWPRKVISEEFIKGNPELISNLIQSLSIKMRSFYTQLYSLRVYDSFVNVCRTLYSMYLYNKVGEIIVPRLTQQEVAAFLGVHRSSLHKALFRLKEEGIIGDYTRKKLDVLDPVRLLEYASGSSDE